MVRHTDAENYQIWFDKSFKKTVTKYSKDKVTNQKIKNKDTPTKDKERVNWKTS